MACRKKRPWSSDWPRDFQDRKVGPELYAKVVEAFGQQGMFELTAVMGDYAMAAIMLRAVDQHVPNPTNELPAIKR